MTRAATVTTVAACVVLAAGTAAVAAVGVTLWREDHALDSISED